MNVQRISISEAALELLEKLKGQHGELIFHQSGGCCDGSAPMCLPKSDFYIDDNDYHLGAIGNCDFFISAEQYEYWQYSHLHVDVCEGRGSSFSLEIPHGLRFITKSRLFTPTEQLHLKAAKKGLPAEFPSA